MDAAGGITREALLAELLRIGESAAFRHSHQHQRFLRYLVECKLEGRLSAVREIALAIDFFHRPANTYDPKADAVVRVEAARLRQRLDRYYHGEGAAAPIEIMLEKGGYLPVFRLRAPTATTEGARPGVIVVSLAPRAAQDADARLAAALTDEIVATLARLPQLRVFGPDSAIAAGVLQAPADAAMRLNVKWIVRAQWSPGEPPTLVLDVLGTHADAPRFSRAIVATGIDALALHQRVRAEALHCFAALIGTSGEDGNRGAHAEVPTRNLEAFDLYQRARYLLRQRNQSLLGNAIEHLEETVRIDAAFSAAWAELANAYVRRRQLVFDPGERDPAPAQRAAQRAIELDAECGSAHAILASLAYTAEFDWAKADRLFARALAATPRDLDVRRGFANFLMFSARFEESLREYDVIQALDPLEPATRCHKGALHFYWRRYDAAELLLLQALEMTPHDVYARLLLADTYAQSGRLEESLAASRELVALAPSYANSHVYTARAMRMLGREADAADVLKRARAQFAASITDYEEAMLHVAGQDAENAFACLERHARQRANGAHCMVVDPTFSSLHADPRWHALLERAGLPDFSDRFARSGTPCTA